MLRGEMKRVDNYPILRPLDHIHLIGLLLDAHIFMDDADTPFPGNGNRHLGGGYGVHSGGHHRDIEHDVPCQAG